MLNSSEIFFSGEEDAQTNKTEIYQLKEAEIRVIIKSEPDHIKRWGNIYELFVKEELSRKRENKESEIESVFRKIIEYMYSKADVFTGKDGKHHSGRPDGVEVGFENEKIIIEIVEMKSSYYAYEHGRDSEQPKRTLETLIALVKIINLVLEGRGNAWILSEFPNFANDKKLWKEEVNELRLKLQATRALLNQSIPKIDISDTINYRIITPSDEKMNGFEPVVISDTKGEHKICISNEKSLLSKLELHQIIIHNLEQVSE